MSRPVLLFVIHVLFAHGYRWHAKKVPLKPHSIAPTFQKPYGASTTTALPVHLNLSLDKSVFPKFEVIKSSKLFLVAAFILSGVLFASMGEDENNENEDNGESVTKNRSSRVATISKSQTLSAGQSKSNQLKSSEGNILKDLLNAIKLLFNIITAKISLGFERLRNTFVSLFGLDEIEPMNLKEWNICEFDGREYIGGSFTKYRFRLPDPDAVLPLYVGQEVVHFYSIRQL